MMFRTVTSPRVLLTVAALIFVASAAHGDDIGHEAARRLARDGLILPLSEIIAAAKKRVPGKVLEVELEREDGSYVYELKILRRNGRVQEVELNAATGKILEIEDDD